MRSSVGKVLAIIPTYNEPEDLRRVVDSLLAQDVEVDVLVVNAGDPLPSDIAAKVKLIDVDDAHYWTHCIDVGLKAAASLSHPFIYLTNADTYAFPGTVRALLETASANEKTVACAPAYIETNDGIRLLYSHQDPLGFLLYGKLVRTWTSPQDAPSQGFPIVLTGGQGVLFQSSVAREFRIDSTNFPHYASDHDLWLQMREKGWRLILLPQTGVVNTRILSAHHAKTIGEKFKKLVWRMTSDKTPESWTIMWRLRRKHLPLFVAVLSTVISFGLRWTVGLPKILRRT